MKVLFVPDYAQGNPYQQALADALCAHKVNVDIQVPFAAKIRPFSILRAASHFWPCDVVHLHWTDIFLLAGKPWWSVVKSCLFLLELLLLRLRGVKLVWTVHNIVNHEQHHRQIELFFSKLTLRLCDCVILHCEKARHEVSQAYKTSLNGRVAVIPHGHYTNFYDNRTSQTEARKLLNIHHRDLVFLHFGAIRSYKATPQLIDAFKRVKSQRATLLIAGLPYSNDIRTQIEKQCQEEERVRVALEFIPDGQLQVYMNAADVVVLPFRDILTSGSVLLAMGFARAIIAPRLGCLPEILDEEGAILYDPNVEDGLHGALEMVSGMDLESMGRHNYDLVSRFDWNEIGKMTYEVYMKCLGNRRTRSEDNVDGHSHAV